LPRSASKLLDSPTLAVDGVVANRVDTVEGYRIWSTSYDQPGNGLFPYEEPIVRGIIDGLPASLALDGACGTGRYAEYLAGRGHRVIGVDSSPDLLEHAAQRVPQVDLRRGDLLRLPLPDRQVDLVVCALALTHVPDLASIPDSSSRCGEPMAPAHTTTSLVALTTSVRPSRRYSTPVAARIPSRVPSPSPASKIRVTWASVMMRTLGRRSTSPSKKAW
jgi:ubiquinone/menaquinone biosynthesis C-methylase UbiE